MKLIYTDSANEILIDGRVVATCIHARHAACLLNKSYALNAARKYTASARMMYQAEQLATFVWIA